MTIGKTRAINILCLHSSIVWSNMKKPGKKRKVKKFIIKEKREKKRGKINLILSHVNHTFFDIERSNWSPSL
jgi:hypothetical protein